MSNMSNDDMINQLRRRKVPYDYELADSIDYAIYCIKAHDSLESTARKYRKLKAEYDNNLNADKLSMLMDLYKDFEDCQTVEECYGLLNRRIADLKAKSEEV